VGQSEMWPVFIATAGVLVGLSGALALLALVGLVLLARRGQARAAAGEVVGVVADGRPPSLIRTPGGAPGGVNEVGVGGGMTIHPHRRLPEGKGTRP